MQQQSDIGGHPFLLEHYRQSLQGALRAGKHFATFGKVPEERDIFLRHDIDNDIAAAKDMSELEAQLGIRSTYFVLLRSPNYNALHSRSVQDLHRIHELGHSIGLHFDANDLSVNGATSSSETTQLERDVDLLAEVLGIEVTAFSYHNPQPEHFSAYYPAHLVNAYHPIYTSDIGYFSESNFLWRPSCPCDQMRSRDVTPIQVLVHPYTYHKPFRDEIDLMATFLCERLNELRQYNIKPSRTLAPHEHSVNRELVFRLGNHG